VVGSSEPVMNILITNDGTKLNKEPLYHYKEEQSIKTWVTEQQYNCVSLLLWAVAYFTELT
jgi:hypothetical protein